MQPRMLILALAFGTLTLAACSAQDGSPDQQLTLSVVASDRNAGEVLLLWEGGSPGRQPLLYRYRPQCCGRSIEGDPGQRITLPPEWGDWLRVPDDRNGRATSHRFGGLKPRIGYEFQMCYGSSCDGALSDPVAAVAPEAGTDGIVYATNQWMLERGGQFRIDRSPYVFTVPMSGAWILVDGENRRCPGASGGRAPGRVPPPPRGGSLPPDPRSRSGRSPLPTGPHGRTGGREGRRPPPAPAPLPPPTLSPVAPRPPRPPGA